jgi:hypothetical protein
MTKKVSVRGSHRVVATVLIVIKKDYKYILYQIVTISYF